MRKWKERENGKRMRKWRANVEIERETENGERIRKWRGDKERMRKWRERK